MPRWFLCPAIYGRASFSTRYSQLVFTVLTEELQVAVEKKALLATCNSYRKEGLNLEEPVRVASPTRINLEEPWVSQPNQD